MEYITINHPHNTTAKNALRNTQATHPSILPRRNNGTNIVVSGSNTVKVRIALAIISKTVSTISQ